MVGIIKEFLRDTKEYFARDIVRISHYNVFMLRIMSVFYLLCLLVYFAAVCIFYDVRLQLAELLPAIIFQILFVAFVYIKSDTLRKKPGMLLAVCEVFGSAIMILIIALSIFVYRDNASLLVSLFLICMCQIYTLPLFNTLFLPAFFGTVFLILSWFLKTPQTFAYDLLAVVIALAIGYSGAVAFMYYKVSEFKSKSLYEKLSSTDLPTGLNNKVKMLELGNGFCSSLADGRKFSLCVLDIDNFKQFNDKFGHSFGDMVISEIGRFMAGYFDADDCVLGRFGGDEFVVLLKEINDADRLDELVSHFISALCQNVSRSLGKDISVSAGVSLCAAGCSFERAFECADAALLEVKRNKKGSYVISEI